MGDAFILHAPGGVSTLMGRELRKRRKPFGLEIVGDPGESLRYVSGLGVFLARPYCVQAMKSQAKAATATLYATDKALQSKYPPTPCRFTVGVSAVAIPDELFGRNGGCQKGPVEHRTRLGFIGTLETLYKCPDVLIKALRICLDRGMALRLSLVGDGVYRARLEQLVARLGLEEWVDFRGKLLPGGPIFDFLRSCDLFVLPSRTEGLPRAMIEAMAVGLPCIGTAVGGVPELLRQDEMVPAGDELALADKIAELLRDPQRRRFLGEHNRRTAERFRVSLRNAKFREFHLAVREAARENPRVA
jgi:glycosyltransferase involved in cell wall biosynthesis